MLVAVSALPVSVSETNKAAAAARVGGLSQTSIQVHGAIVSF